MKKLVCLLMLCLPFSVYAQRGFSERGCKLTLKDAPSFRGLKLGMKFDELNAWRFFESVESVDGKTKKATVKLEDVRYDLIFVSDVLSSIDANYFLDEDFSSVDIFAVHLNLEWLQDFNWRKEGNNRVVDCHDFSITAMLPETFMPKILIKIIPPKPFEKPKRTFKP